MKILLRKNPQRKLKLWWKKESGVKVPTDTPTIFCYQDRHCQNFIMAQDGSILVSVFDSFRSICYPSLEIMCSEIPLKATCSSGKLSQGSCKIKWESWRTHSPSFLNYFLLSTNHFVTFWSIILIWRRRIVFQFIRLITEDLIFFI